jgi:hypothetical protein
VRSIYENLRTDPGQASQNHSGTNRPILPGASAAAPARQKDETVRFIAPIEALKDKIDKLVSFELFPIENGGDYGCALGCMHGCKGHRVQAARLTLQ